MEQQFFMTVAANGALAPLQPSQLGFGAVSIRIDNPTGAWLLHTVSGAHIGPYTIGYAANIDGTQIGEIRNDAPPGTLNQPQAGQTVVVTFSDQPVSSPSSGTEIVNPIIRSAVFTSVAAGAPPVFPTINTGTLTFQARSVRIDNPTGQWFQITPPGLYIPPYTVGWTIPLTASAGPFVIAPNTPPGETSNPIAGETVAVLFTDQSVLPNAGSTFGPNQIQTQRFVMTVVPGPTLNPLSAVTTFPARNVRIDNVTGGWLGVGALAIIPPWTTGFSLNLTPSTAPPTISNFTPVGEISELIVGQIVNVVYSDRELTDAGPIPYEDVTRQFSFALNSFAGNPPTIAIYSPTLGFAARSAVIDNLSGSWMAMSVPFGVGSKWNGFIPPYTKGFAVNFTPDTTPGVQSASVPTFDSTPVAGQYVTVSFSAKPVAESGGTPLSNIYELQQTYTSTVNGVPVLPAINVNTATNIPPFTGHSIRIDNPTGCWLYVAGPGAYVPPYTIGWAMNLAPFTLATVTNVTPPGQLSFPITGQIVTVIVSDRFVQESNGVLVQNPDVAAPPRIFTFTVQAQALGGVATVTPIIAGVANRRIRVLSLETHWFGFLVAAGAALPVDNLFDVGTGLPLHQYQHYLAGAIGAFAQDSYELANDSGLFETTLLGFGISMAVVGTAVISQSYLVQGSYILI